jgi:hypothetical protein
VVFLLGSAEGIRFDQDSALERFKAIVSELGLESPRTSEALFKDSRALGALLYNPYNRLISVENCLIGAEPMNFMDLRGAVFTSVDFEGTHLAAVDATGAKFYGCTARGVHADGALLKKIKAAPANNGRECDFSSPKGVPQNRFVHVQFIDAALYGTLFKNSLLSYAEWFGVSMKCFEGSVRSAYQRLRLIRQQFGDSPVHIQNFDEPHQRMLIGDPKEFAIAMKAGRGHSTEPYIPSLSELETFIGHSSLFPNPVETRHTAKLWAGGIVTGGIRTMGTVQITVGAEPAQATVTGDLRVVTLPNDNRLLLHSRSGTNECSVYFAPPGNRDEWIPLNSGQPVRNDVVLQIIARAARGEDPLEIDTTPRELGEINSDLLKYTTRKRGTGGYYWNSYSPPQPPQQIDIQIGTGSTGTNTTGTRSMGTNAFGTSDLKLHP